MPFTLPVSYTSVVLMQGTLPEIGSLTTLTSAHVAQFAGEAQSFVNGKIAKRYALPLTEEVPLLQTLTTKIALYYLLSQRLYTAQRLEDSPWPGRYKEAVDTLEEVSDGKVSLVSASGTVLAGRSDISEVWSTTKDYVPTFHEGPTGDHTQDSDKINDELDRRGSGMTDRLI